MVEITIKLDDDKVKFLIEEAVLEYMKKQALLRFIRDEVKKYCKISKGGKR